MNERRLIKANELHTTIRFFHEMFPDQLEKTDIKICSHCSGIGFEKLGARYS